MSNVRINLYKMQAFSLSGSPLPDWSSTLRSHNITDWHDRTSPAPLHYLGFRLRTAAIFTHLALSFWIRSIMSSFLQRSTFPRFLWILSVSHACKADLVSSILRRSRALYNFVGFNLSSALFGSHLVWSRAGFFAVIDHLLHNFDNVVVNSTTCLALPLSAVTIVPASQARFPPSWQDLLVSHLYTFDPALASLQSISITSSHQHSHVINKFFGRVQLNILTLHSIIVCACCSPCELTEQYPSLLVQDGTSIDLFPFFNALIPSQTWARLSTRTFCGLCSHHLVRARYFDPPCGSRHWQKFWSFPLLLVARNIWFCGLHDKISCRTHLHSLLPLAFPSPTCSIYSLSSDSQGHFFFTCPLKNAVWIGMWLEFFGTIPTPTALHNAFHFFSFPSSLNSFIPLSTVFGCTLLAIWRHH
ncbi:hypothetical protein PHYBLDRAFT_152944 [Phycomyces blakesleeanus NRRL 1555(-)]|uniref:Reverse transcriptase zinc-binding domain-containing protein n=1 Tax=Phycomyces blakesleeanus (strain ATCC 8743b / DSM 1359 / FGSC 10004 / NBRC 33097 / NRRL 1555) TaxID=763407 RepID=A0A167JFZ5_PHYB8|nr:hypothetical protein PHYBLDRAFT_152944 [Phycomyces blakesleeanus NRRL 1555(-)]OAD65917.1 hypothetical protein PHYBLDRAFT_152944 [Phycomyces blakesleeanus NRRL 1555(-)]|eukprot:XP_018283957.1 hypothetical protein PHYBLDRAFT_152944 [Phycomyces blakesleeanus NRRL 1555(-)]